VAWLKLLRFLGYEVHGSDREVAEPARQELFAKLRGQGIGIWAQDGSGLRSTSPVARGLLLGGRVV